MWQNPPTTDTPNLRPNPAMNYTRPAPYSLDQANYHSYNTYPNTSDASELGWFQNQLLNDMPLPGAFDYFGSMWNPPDVMSNYHQTLSPQQAPQNIGMQSPNPQRVGVQSPNQASQNIGMQSPNQRSQNIGIQSPNQVSQNTRVSPQNSVMSPENSTIQNEANSYLSSRAPSVKTDSPKMSSPNNSISPQSSDIPPLNAHIPSPNTRISPTNASIHPQNININGLTADNANTPPSSASLPLHNSSGLPQDNRLAPNKRTSPQAVIASPQNTGIPPQNAPISSPSTAISPEGISTQGSGMSPANIPMPTPTIFQESIPQTKDSGVKSNKYLSNVSLNNGGSNSNRNTPTQQRNISSPNIVSSASINVKTEPIDVSSPSSNVNTTSVQMNSAFPANMGPSFNTNMDWSRFSPYGMMNGMMDPAQALQNSYMAVKMQNAGHSGLPIDKIGLTSPPNLPNSIPNHPNSIPNLSSSIPNFPNSSPGANMKGGLKLENGMLPRMQQPMWPSEWWYGQNPFMKVDPLYQSMFLNSMNNGIPGMGGMQGMNGIPGMNGILGMNGIPGMNGMSNRMDGMLNGMMPNNVNTLQNSMNSINGMRNGSTNPFNNIENSINPNSLNNLNSLSKNLNGLGNNSNSPNSTSSNSNFPLASEKTQRVTSLTTNIDWKSLLIGKDGLPNKYIALEEGLCEALKAFVPVTKKVFCIYNPLEYASDIHQQFIRKFCVTEKRVMFLGMNPGPFGMGQTGIPFGEVSIVRDWMGIDGQIRKPTYEHPKRPVTGFDCKRKEVSGTRFWQLFKERFASAEEFFTNAFVCNYCPIMFMNEQGKNIIPPSLLKQDRDLLFDCCDMALNEIMLLYKIEVVVSLGKFVHKRVEVAISKMQRELGHLRLVCMMHPSPVQPAANKDWEKTALAQLQEAGVIQMLEVG